MNKRKLIILKFVAMAAALLLLTWGASAIVVYAVSSGRVFDSASIDAVPRQRAAVVMGCVRTLPNGLDNLYFSRRIDVAAELYKAGAAIPSSSALVRRPRHMSVTFQAVV